MEALDLTFQDYYAGETGNSAGILPPVEGVGELGFYSSAMEERYTGCISEGHALFITVHSLRNCKGR